MAVKKVIFIAFAKEDEASRNLFSGQKVHPASPFEFTDMSVKEPYDREWKERNSHPDPPQRRCYRSALGLHARRRRRALGDRLRA